MKVERDGLYLCQDCTGISCNGIHGNEIENSERADFILARLTLPEFKYLVPSFDSETGEGLHEFSSVPCAVCKTPLAGYRAEFATLTE